MCWLNPVSDGIAKYFFKAGIQERHVGLLSFDGVWEETVCFIGQEEVDWHLFHAHNNRGLSYIFLDDCTSICICLSRNHNYHSLQQENLLKKKVSIHLHWICTAVGRLHKYLEFQEKKGNQLGTEGDLWFKAIEIYLWLRPGPVSGHWRAIEGLFSPILTDLLSL